MNESGKTGDRATISFSFISTTPQKITGLSSYTESLVSAYATLHADRKILFLTNAVGEIFPAFTKHPNIEIVPIFVRGSIPFKIYSILAHVVASFKARSRKARDYISTTPQGSVLPFVGQTIVIHDMYDVDARYRPRLHVLYTKIMLSIYALVSKRVVCVSDATFEDALKLIGRSRSKVRIVKEASKFLPMHEADALAQARNGRVLYVANVEGTKNVGCLLEALRLAESRGIPLQVNWIGRDPSSIVADWLAKHGPLANFHSLGAVDDERLLLEYKQSNALVVTSLREGFCLPILEANAHGTPAIVSDIDILREVAGSAGKFFDPGKPEDCLEKMNGVLADMAGYPERQKLALENARKYSWADSAAKLEELLTEDRRGA